MRMFYLHIGMHKAGTNLIQQGLGRRRMVLAGQPLSYSPGAEANRSRAVFPAFTLPPSPAQGSDPRRTKRAAPSPA